MLRSQWIAATLACLAGVAQAEDVDFSVKSKAIASSMVAAPKAVAPFASAREPAALRESIPFNVEHSLDDTRLPHSACERSAHDLCYDAADGRIVYRAARNYMPRIGELTPENISLRRNRIIFKYSF